ncbi:hypothetical protein NDU88_010716, partial [Pleurodeles waltl]
ENPEGGSRAGEETEKTRERPTRDPGPGRRRVSADLKMPYPEAGPQRPDSLAGHVPGGAWLKQ